MDLTLPMDGDSAEPLHRQVYGGLRRAILSGRLGPGQRVPSTRAMAQALGLSRTTVTRSYEDLISEGYLTTASGSGTFVCEHLPEALLESTRSQAKIVSGEDGEQLPAPLSEYGARVAESLARSNGGDDGDYDREHDRRGAEISFSFGRPDFEAAPMREWGRLLSRHCRRASGKMLDYSGKPQGHGPLREAIAKYVGAARAVQCRADQVVILNGAQQALDLIARLVVNPGDGVAIENPGYPGALLTFRTQGARLFPIPVDAAGMEVSRLHQPADRKIKAVHVTPSHQFPMGVALSLPRRLELLAWARQQGALIIEDDYDSEYRYGGRPIPALQGLTPTSNDSVVYVGTFSKVLFPSLRIAYVIAPPRLVPIILRAKWLADRQAPLLEQYALTDFITEGSLERHIRRMRTIYGKRRETLLTELDRRLGDKIRIIGENAGMHVMVKLATGVPDREFVRLALGEGVSLMPAARCYYDDVPGGEFIMGFAGINERMIREGVKRLSRAMEGGGKRN